MEGNTATARKELKREEMDGRVEAVKGVLGRNVMRKGVWEEEEVKEVVASFITSLFFSGPLNPCLPVLLTAETSHGMLEAVSRVITSSYLSYHLELFLVSSPPPILPVHPPGRSPIAPGTYCVAYCLLAPLPLIARAVEVIPTTDWFPGAERFFVIYSGRDLSSAALRDSQPLLKAYNTLYLVHSAPFALDLYATCPFCRGGEAEVTQRNEWRRGKGLHRPDDPLFPDLFQDLNGRRFRAVTLHFPPFNHYLSGSSTEPLDMQDCLDKRIVDAISETYNFTYQVFEPADGFWGFESSPGNFTGVVGEVQHRLADFSLDLSVVAEREVIIDFSIGYLLEPLTFVTSKPKPLPQWQAVVRPFGGGVWASLGAVLLLSGPLLWLLRRLSDSPASMPDAVFHTFAALVCQSRQWPRPTPVRVFVASWLLLCLVAAVSFVGNLTAFLTVPAYSPTLETLDDLIRSDFKWGINDFGAADYQLFKTSDVPLYQEIFKGLTFCSGLVPCIQKALDEPFAFISFSTYLRDAVAMHFIDRNGDTQVYMAQDRFFPADTGFALQKGSPLKRLFDRVLRRLLEAGLVDKWLNDLIQEHTLATRGGGGTWAEGGGVDGGPDADHLPPAGRVHGVRRGTPALRPHLRLRAGGAGRVGGQGSRQRLGVKPNCRVRLGVGSRGSISPFCSATQSQHLLFPLICYL
ncbi:glutamate receptor ionotropic, delta-2-like isoform X2 [Eriocheir sinensis]|nr:glutamate receptor ionotropic, delta-2-like isoform X2 [Eriocheir sinensis]